VQAQAQDGSCHCRHIATLRAAPAVIAFEAEAL
jgi:hypothetical protein